MEYNTLTVAQAQFRLEAGDQFEKFIMMARIYKRAVSREKFISVLLENFNMTKEEASILADGTELYMKHFS